MTSEVLFTQKKHLGIMTLSRPSALNALSFAMIQAMQAQLSAWADDASIHAVMIQSDNPKAFCAGGDVRSLYEMGRNDPKHGMDFFAQEYRLNYTISQYPKPYIALLDGITMGGGVGVSLHGSHAVATENFKFAMPETTIGFFPDIGASHLLSRCPSELGIYLGLSGNRLNAKEALYCGLVKAMIGSEAQAEFVEALLAVDLKTDPFAAVSACLLPFQSKSQTPIQSQTAEPIQAHVATVESCFSQSSVEGICERLKNSQDPWAQEVYATVLTKSPLSLKVSLEQLRRAKSLSMAQCLKMDYCLVGHFMQDKDFYEGVRALLIDKDKSPRWQPASLAAVSAEKVADYFECVGSELNLFEVA